SSAVVLTANSRYKSESGSIRYSHPISHAIQTDMTYDQFARTLHPATGDAYENPSANYLRVIRDTSTATENVTQLFLGVRFSCNKCHDHPFERWTQNQYYQLGAYFAQTGFKPGQSGDEFVYDKRDGEVTHPKSGMAV